MGFPGTSDGLRQKFTSKERDNETGLDYFLARYYSSTQGRFISPDEFTGGPDELYYFADDASANPTFYGDLNKPQSFNKYQYAYNNPLRWVDPDGHDPEEPEPQEPKTVVPVRTPGRFPPVTVTVGETPKGPTDQQIIEGSLSCLDAVCDATGITTVADLLRPIVFPAPAPEPTIEPVPIPPQVSPAPMVQPAPPPAPIQAHKKKKQSTGKNKNHPKDTERPGRRNT